MQRLPVPLLLVAVLLAALAGFVDAVAFSSFAGFFASFMSGNTTRLGVAVASGLQAEMRTAAALLLGFVSGVMGGAIAARAAGMRAREAVMLLVTTLLALAALCVGFGPRQLGLVLLAAAMGAENAVFSGNGEVRVGLTYMTGTLVRFGQRLADALMGVGGRLGWWRDLLFWGGFVFGTVGGAGAFQLIGDLAIWIAALLAGLLTLLVARMPADA
ncbi:YoaK family protein [Sphingomonas sp. ac-8]|uniref:YoaK family protein n=1 Tax=Sphingomonas sp. ac-8 TaxID=3242977 RepID=UPI003A80866D